MKRLLTTLAALLVVAPLAAQTVGGGSGNATAIQGHTIASTAPANGNCLVFTTIWGPGSCSGTASTGWANLTSGTNTTAAMVVGTGASLGATGSGTIAATSVPAAGLGAGTIGNATTGNAATATAFAAVPAQCTTGEYATGIAAPGTANCAQVTFAQLGGSPTAAQVATAGTLSNSTSGTAANVTGVVATANGGTGATSLGAADIPVQTGTITAGDCAKWASATSITDAGATCGGGGGGTAMTRWYDTSVVGGGASKSLAAANQITIGSILLQAPVKVTHIEWYVYTPDSSGDYDLGIYNSSGQLQCDIGAGTWFSSTGFASRPIVQSGGSVTLAAGEYYLAFTGTAVTGGLYLSSASTVGGMDAAVGTTVSSTTSSGGALPSTIAMPTLTAGFRNPVALVLY